MQEKCKNLQGKQKESIIDDLIKQRTTRRKQQEQEATREAVRREQH